MLAISDIGKTMPQINIMQLPILTYGMQKY